MTPKSRSTSSLSSTADGSSMMISCASCDSARAMLTICCAAADSEPTSAAGRISGWPRRVSSSAAARLATAGPGEAEARLLAAEEDVVGDGQAGDEVELLVDRRDAEAHGGLRVAERHRLAAPGDRALVRLVRPGEDLDQGRLAGAVLAEQAVHLARRGRRGRRRPAPGRPGTSSRCRASPAAARRRTACGHVVPRRPSTSGLLLNADH